MVSVMPLEAEFPMHYISTDVLTIGRNSNGFDHVLVIEDRYTRYCCLFPIAGYEASTIARKLEIFVTRFGFPVVWGSDNGPEQRNRLTEALAKLYDTRKSGREEEPHNSGRVTGQGAQI